MSPAAWRPCSSRREHEAHIWKRGSSPFGCPGVQSRAGKVVRMAGHDYLDIAGIAARLGVKPSSVQVYHTRAKRNRKAGESLAWDLPAPDATFGRTPVWLIPTIETWEATRPGTNTDAATAARRKGSGDA